MCSMCVPCSQKGWYQKKNYIRDLVTYTVKYLLVQYNTSVNCTEPTLNGSNIEALLYCMSTLQTFYQKLGYNNVFGNDAANLK